MTLLLSWVGKDSRKISSAYIASDSRFSWADGQNYDYGKKVFALQNSPDILGFCGDVMYLTTIFSQIVEMDKDGILYPTSASNEARMQIMFEKIKEKFDKYPKDKLQETLEIIHFLRYGELEFNCYIYSWSRLNGWSCTQTEVPTESKEVIILGSGSNEFSKKFNKYLKANNEKTSRALFQCLCHTLLEIEDKQCGGPPQLVGLYNKFNGKNFGIIYNDRRFYLGTEITENTNICNLEWRNKKFERCNGITRKILQGAQMQPNELNP